MISRITGTLEHLEEGKAIISLTLGEGAQISYEILLPALLAPQLGPRLGQSITLHTIQYLEAVAQGASFTPRLIGFTEPADKRFFELLTKVKGLGVRKALRAFTEPAAHIARAIAAQDAAALARLPEIGKRTAEAVILELKGRIEPFLVDDLDGPGHAATRAGTRPSSPALQQAVAALVRLGESRPIAEQLVDAACRANPEARTPDELLAAALAARQ